MPTLAHVHPVRCLNKYQKYSKKSNFLPNFNKNYLRISSYALEKVSTPFLIAMLSRLHYIFFLLAFVCVSLPVFAEDPFDVIGGEDHTAELHDPFEPINRATFKFNEGFDKFVFNPLVVTLTFFMPPVVREGVRNFFCNLNEVASVVNHTLQGKRKGAGRSLLRFAVNSTLGLAGLLDVASWMGFEEIPNSFNLTLRHWGVSPGAYFVWPVLGPSSMRDGVGVMVDFFFDPLNIFLMTQGKKRLLDTKVIIAMIQEKEKYWEELWNLKKEAVDPYVLERSIYYQKRHLLYSLDEGPQPVE